MADQNIALGVQVPDSFKTISGLLNFAGQAQSLRTAQQEYERGGISLEREKALLKPSIAKGEAESQSAQTQAKSHAFKLENEYANAALNEAAALYKDPRIVNSDPTGTVEALMEARDRMISRGIPKDKAEWQTSQLISKAHTPGAVYQNLQNIIQGNAGAATQAAVVNAPMQLVNTGATLQPVQMQPGAPGAIDPSKPIPTTLPPGQLENVDTDALGNKSVISRSPAGVITGTRPVPGSTGGAGTGFAAFGPGDREAIPVLEGERTQARNLLSSAPIAHTTNRGILEELDKVGATGKFGPTLASIASRLGIAFDTPERMASAYDLIGKYTERNALEAAKAMGPGTNAGLEAAIKANGSAAYNPTALKKITRLNDALVTGAELYQPGLERAISADPNRGVLVKREYDQAWAQNFDPTLIELTTAQRNGDKATVQELIKSLGGANSPRATEMFRKAAVLERLSTTGKP